VEVSLYTKNVRKNVYPYLNGLLAGHELPLASISKPMVLIFGLNSDQ